MLKQSDFEKGVVRTRRYRNRRIGSFLKELGLTEGKGTGIPVIYKVLKDNGSPDPIFDTDSPNRSFFVVEFPISPDFRDDGGAIEQVTPQVTPQAGNHAETVLRFCSVPHNRDEIQSFLGLKDREYFRKKILKPLIDSGKLKLTIPDKPTSPKQKYIAMQKQDK